MRTRGRRIIALGVVALSTIGALTMPGFAAPAPNPSLSITTLLPGGVASPVSSVSGSWSVATTGREAKLSTSGVIASGTTTKVVGEWTSPSYRPKPHGEMLQVSFDYDHLYPLDLSAADEGIQFRLRLPKLGWSPWFGITVQHAPAGVLFSESGGGGTALVMSGRPPHYSGQWPPTVQVGVRFSADYTATGQVSESFDVKTG